MYSLMPWEKLSSTIRKFNYIYIYTDSLSKQLEVIIVEQVDVSKVAGDPKSRLDECKRREWYWQNQLKTLKQYGGMNVREERL